MSQPGLVDTFIEQFDKLRIVVSDSEKRIVQDEPDLLFFDNQNVFIKAYLVSACSILEAFIQDVASEYALRMQKQINDLQVPHNLVHWFAENEKYKSKYAAFIGKRTKKDIANLISPNFYKTVTAFEKIGINISSDELLSFKDFISGVVDKRNKIVHHNDQTSDVSFRDIILAIDTFKAYAGCIAAAVPN